MSPISPTGGVARYHPVLVTLHWLAALVLKDGLSCRMAFGRR